MNILDNRIVPRTLNLDEKQTQIFTGTLPGLRQNLGDLVSERSLDELALGTIDHGDLESPSNNLVREMGWGILGSQGLLNSFSVDLVGDEVDKLHIVSVAFSQGRLTGARSLRFHEVPPHAFKDDPIQAGLVSIFPYSSIAAVERSMRGKGVASALLASLFIDGMQNLRDLMKYEPDKFMDGFLSKDDKERLEGNLDGLRQVFGEEGRLLYQIRTTYGGDFADAEVRALKRAGIKVRQKRFDGKTNGIVGAVLGHKAEQVDPELIDASTGIINHFWVNRQPMSGGRGSFQETMSWRSSVFFRNVGQEIRESIAREVLEKAQLSAEYKFEDVQEIILRHGVNIQDFDILGIPVLNRTIQLTLPSL
jgi:hypothetical protein